MRLTRYERCCPHCGCCFDTVFNPTALRLGSGYRRCDECREIFSDGSIEWPALTVEQKQKFLFGELRQAGAMGFLASAFVMFFAVWDGETELGLAFIGVLFAFSLVILGIFYLICWVDISRSKRRYETHPSNPRPVEPNLNPRAVQLLRDGARRSAK